ncbi:MAG: hypothetical protein KatS3mg110_2576 [Pirellulaceae bacterium]|nr:MAG: hypothetical protein KatS3mg110_2576 [Pirellulaceae bacterium]
MDDSDSSHTQRPHGAGPTTGRSARRLFLRVAMAGGLVAGYGTLGVMAGRFLYSNGQPSRRWQFVTTIDALAVGDAILYEAPNGAKLIIARQKEGETDDCFAALSSICPHLGCLVHWEPQNERFFCPCHNGIFDKGGKAISGPPAAAGQQLTRFPVKVDRGRLFVLAPVESLLELNVACRSHTTCRLAGHFRARAGEPRRAEV